MANPMQGLFDTITSRVSPKTLKLIGLLLLIAVLPLTVFIALQQQNLVQRASPNGVVQFASDQTGNNIIQTTTNPEIYLRITKPDNWDLASSNNPRMMSLLPQAHAQAACPQAGETGSKTTCGYSTYDTCQDNLGNFENESEFCRGSATKFVCWYSQNANCTSNQGGVFPYNCSACGFPAPPPNTTPTPTPTRVPAVWARDPNNPSSCQLFATTQDVPPGWEVVSRCNQPTKTPTPRPTNIPNQSTNTPVPTQPANNSISATGCDISPRKVDVANPGTPQMTISFTSPPGIGSRIVVNVVSNTPDSWTQVANGTVGNNNSGQSLPLYLEEKGFNPGEHATRVQLIRNGTIAVDGTCGSIGFEETQSSEPTPVPKTILYQIHIENIDDGSGGDAPRRITGAAEIGSFLANPRWRLNPEGPNPKRVQVDFYNAAAAADVNLTAGHIAAIGEITYAPPAQTQNQPTVPPQVPATAAPVFSSRTGTGDLYYICRTYPNHELRATWDIAQPTGAFGCNIYIQAEGKAYQISTSCKDSKLIPGKLIDNRGESKPDHIITNDGIYELYASNDGTPGKLIKQARLNCPTAPTTPPSTPTPSPTTPVLRPDANNDGKVDIEDFNIWRDEYLGKVATKRSDFDNDGAITLKDYNMWRNYGYTPPS